MYSDRRGNGQKPPRIKPSRQKTPWQTPQTKSPMNNWERICTGAFVQVFCTRYTKNRGVPRCVTYFRGRARDVWQGEGGQNWPKIAWLILWTAPCGRMRLLERLHPGYQQVTPPEMQCFICPPPEMQCFICLLNCSLALACASTFSFQALDKARLIQRKPNVSFIYPSCKSVFCSCFRFLVYCLLNHCCCNA